MLTDGTRSKYRRSRHYMAFPQPAFNPYSGLKRTKSRTLFAVRGDFYAASYPAETREQTRTNVNDLDRETLILREFPAKALRS